MELYDSPQDLIASRWPWTATYATKNPCRAGVKGLIHFGGLRGVQVLLCSPQ
jgi:hypothetical protein